MQTQLKVRQNVHIEIIEALASDGDVAPKDAQQGKKSRAQLQVNPARLWD